MREDADLGQPGGGRRGVQFAHERRAVVAQQHLRERRSRGDVEQIGRVEIARERRLVERDDGLEAAGTEEALEDRVEAFAFVGALGQDQLQRVLDRRSVVVPDQLDRLERIERRGRRDAQPGDARDADEIQNRPFHARSVPAAAHVLEQPREFARRGFDVDFVFEQQVQRIAHEAGVELVHVQQ